MPVDVREQPAWPSWRAGRERKLWAAFEEWWKAEADQIANLEPVEGDERTEHERKAQLARLRADLIDSFRQRLLAVGLLDRYALAGAVAGWWHEAKNDLKALSVNGFGGVVDGWVETVLTMLAPEPDPRTGGARDRTAGERRQAYDHKVVAAIAPDFLDDLASAERTHADLDAKVKAAQEAEAALAEARAAAESPDADSEGPAEIDPALIEAVLSKAEMRELTKQRAEAKKAIEELEDDFWPVAAVQRKKAEQREKAKKKAGGGRSGTGGAAKGRRALAAKEAGQGALLEIPVPSPVPGSSPVPVEGTDAESGADGDGPGEGGAVKEARQRRARREIIAWYRKAGLRWAEGRLQPWAARMEVPEPAVTVRDVGNRWGTYRQGEGENGRVALHWAVFQLSSHLVDYVIAHELAHIKIAGHGPDYWTLLKRAIPDCESRKEELDDLGRRLWLGEIMGTGDG